MIFGLPLGRVLFYITLEVKFDLLSALLCFPHIPIPCPIYQSLALVAVPLMADVQNEAVLWVAGGGQQGCDPASRAHSCESRLTFFCVRLLTAVYMCECFAAGSCSACESHTGTGVTGDCELPHGCWDPKPGIQQK